MRSQDKLVYVLFTLMLSVSVSAGRKNKGITYAPCKKLCKRMSMKNCAKSCRVKKGYTVNDKCWKLCLQEDIQGDTVGPVSCLKKCLIKADSCQWTEWGEWKYSSCMQSDIQ
ncbi:unnamed protein product, partial [Owenia fusiformis]